MNPKLFFKFISISFQKQVTYRFDCFVGIFNGLLYVFIFTSLWKALYSQFDTKEHNGFTLHAIITYVVTVMAVRISFTMDDSIIYKKVQNGSIAMELVRPTSFFFMNLAENAGHSLFHILARTCPIVLLSAILFDISVPFEPVRLLAFLFSSLIGYLLLSMLNFITGLLAFWFLEIFPFMLFKYALFTFFAGGIVPIDYFPEYLKPFVHFLPFQHMLYSPTVILIGHVPLEKIQPIIITQLAWLLIMSVLCVLMWNAGKKKLIIQGG
ncbi:MAG: ABC-2 family transporter protein [Candidatus Brocadiaceae bacterium]|nr:ABC-2 family transporter protein [Candidatus Brocadiaceae bacterium]